MAGIVDPDELDFRRILELADPYLGEIVGEYTDWIMVRFRMAPGVTVSGICRFLLIRTEPEFELYVTPINLEPEKSAMPISFPAAYSGWAGCTACGPARKRLW